MTSEERREARYQRRRARRLAKVEERNRALGGVEEIFGYRKLYKLGKRCCNGVRGKASTTAFETHLFSGTAARGRAVRSGAWRGKPYHWFVLNERGKTREINAPHITDRQIHKAISQKILLPLYTPSMIWENGASQKGKGTEWHYKLLKKHLLEHWKRYGRKGGIFLLDLKGYFYNVPYRLVLDRHQRLIRDKRLRELADKTVIQAMKTPKVRGLPLGVEPSQQEMVSLPGPVDQWLKCEKRARGMAHLMDDYYLLWPDIQELEEIAKEMIERFQRMGIAVNLDKCRIVPLEKPFRFCKVKYTLRADGKIKMNRNRDSARRCWRKAKMFWREWKSGRMELERICHDLSGHLAYYRKFDDYGRYLALRDKVLKLFGGAIQCKKYFCPREARPLG